MTEIFERLVAANIQIVPDLSFPSHFVFERGGYAALVERKDEAFGNIGAAGLLTEHGLAFLIWSNGDPQFVARGFQIPATAEQVAAVRTFASDLEYALQGPDRPAADQNSSH